MKRNEITELSTKTSDELKRALADLREELEKLKKDEVGKKIKNTNLVRVKKKDVARVLTFLKMKTIDVVSGLENIKDQGKSREAGSRSAGEVKNNG